MPKRSPGVPPSLRRNGVKPVSIHAYDPDDPALVAIHEAGHAVAAVVLGLPLKFVDLKHRRLSDDYVSFGMTELGPLSIENEAALKTTGFKVMVESIAGPLSEAKANPHSWDHGGYQKDMEGAQRAAIFVVCDKEFVDDCVQVARGEAARHEREINDLIQAAAREANELVQNYWAAIVNVAGLLIRQESLSGPEVVAIIIAVMKARLSALEAEAAEASASSTRYKAILKRLLGP